jgi:hypothetical protein
MTAQHGERAPARTSASANVSGKTLLGAAALLSGLAAGWLAAGSFGVLAAMAVLLAAGNGYAKAYSP